MAPNKHYLISTLQLEPHIEGGYFRRTFSSTTFAKVSCREKERMILSSIYYLVTDEQRVSYMVENKSDIIRYFHLGAPVTFYVVSPNGQLDKYVMGTDIENGHIMQFAAEGGSWVASVLEEGDYGLISEAVAPGFEYEDMRLIRREEVQQKFPDLVNRIGHLLKE